MMSVEEETGDVPSSNQQHEERTVQDGMAADPFRRPEQEKIKALVVDANGLIKGIRLDNLAEKLYTLREVVAEVRDKTARAMLASAPFELVYREPTPESLKAVMDFARKTGDFSSLSVVDLRVLALTYTIEKETKGNVEHLRKEPVRSGPRVKGGKALARETTTQIGVVGTSPASTQQPHEAGHADHAASIENNQAAPADSESSAGQAGDGDEESSIAAQLEGMTLEGELDDDSEHGSDDEPDKAAADGESQAHEGANPSDEAGEFQQVSSGKGAAVHKPGKVPAKELADDEGWITPSNIHKASKTFDPFGDVKIEKKPEVACLTTDFAMQNVLIQMGLPVVSVDGMLIKRAKTYVLRCHACFKVTMQMDKQFCPACGNGNTLVKIAASVDRYGQTHYHTMRTRKTNLRGTKYSIPAPKGGRHAHNIILREDQKEYKDAVQRQQRFERALEKGLDIFSPEYMTQGSPFGVAGPHERAQVGFGKRNPNEVKRTGNRKKKSASRRQFS